jgi:hypothetical protein
VTLRTQHPRRISEYGQQLSARQRHLASPDFQWLRVFEAFPHFTGRLIVHLLNGGRPWNFNARRRRGPQDPALRPLVRNFGSDGPLEDVLWVNLQVCNADRAIVESQRPEHLPPHIRAETHIVANSRRRRAGLGS